MHSQQNTSCSAETDKVKVKSDSRSVMSNSLWPRRAPYSPWNSLGQNTKVGSCSLLQGIFPTQGLNSGLLHCRQILCHLRNLGNPRILEWVTYPFSRESSWLRNPTWISCIVGEFFTSWAATEALGTRIIKFDSWQAESGGKNGTAI